MAQRVVDLFESVKVDQQRGEERLRDRDELVKQLSRTSLPMREVDETASPARARRIISTTFGSSLYISKTESPTN